MKNNNSNYFLPYFFAGIGYLVLAIIFTYPLMINFSHAVSGWQAMNDSELFLWNFWWVKYALVNLHTNPFYTTYIYQPFNVNLTLHTITLFPALIAMILQFFSKNIIIVYNILFLATFIASGLGTFALVKYLLKNNWIAFIGGVAFSFCPYIFAHAYAGHFNLINTWSLPLFVLFFIRIFEEKKNKYVFWTALILILQIYTDWHYVFFLGIISIIVVIYYLIKNRNEIWPNLKNLVILIIICLVFSLPILIPTLKFSKIYNVYQAGRTNYRPAMQYTDLRHFLPGPNYLNIKLWDNELRDNIEKEYSGGIRENNVFFGYVIMILAFCGLFFSTLKNRFLYLTIAVIFFTLSLGNYLYFNGKQIISWKLPYFYLSNTVFQNSDVVFSRFSIITMLMLIILAGGFIAYLIDKLKRQNYQYLIYSALFLAICLEFYPAPIALTQINTPGILKTISQKQGDFGVIILPSRMYYQTILQKPQLTGGLGRRAHDYYQDIGPYKSIPGVRLLYDIPNNQINPNEDDLNQKLVLEQFKKYNIKYIILDKDKTPEGQIADYQKILEQILKLTIYYNDNIVKIYKTGL